jgi:hypothetical protein
MTRKLEAIRGLRDHLDHLGCMRQSDIQQRRHEIQPALHDAFKELVDCLEGQARRPSTNAASAATCEGDEGNE